MNIGFRASGQMLPELLPIFFSDATHMTGASSGNMMYCTVALDANNHIVPILCTHCVGEECAIGWLYHVLAVKEFCQQFHPKQQFLIIIDGIASGIRQRVPNFHVFPALTKAHE
jgi:hypothetical protein